tara:strand:+ start:2001 stop:3584 length:1584 start_codon:yes stop_codon:yes gene_type:complete
MPQKKLIQNLNKKVISEIKANIPIIFLSIFSLSITFYYGYQGVFPLDSFLIYDAGYKLLNGFHPFKDYWSITGPFLDYIQFFFFKILGINWFSYVIHSAIINFFLTIIFYNFLIKLSLSKTSSFIYSLSIAILAYPSAGTPFMDHHAAIFSLISVLFTILAFKNNRPIYWFLVPFFLFISFLSKQIPSAYLLVLTIIFIFIYKQTSSPKNYKFLNYLILGSVASFFLFFFIIIINNIPLSNFFTQYLFYPIEIGNSRGSSISFDLKNTIFQFKFIYFSLIPLILISLIIIKHFKKLENKTDLIIVIFVILSVIVFIYSQIMTKNQILIFFLIPFCLGVSNCFIQKYFNNKLLTGFILFILILATLKFHIRFNENKKFMELSGVDLNIAVDAKKISTSLKGLKWISPEYSENPMEEIQLINYAKEKILMDNTKKIIISDYQILPSIIGLKTAAPNKWFDILSVPGEENKFFLSYKNFFLEKINKQKIETIYLIGEKEIFLKNILKSGCFNTEVLNEKIKKINITNCLE